MHLGAYRAVQGSGLRVDLHLGLHRAAGQLKGRRECQAALVQAQVGDEVLQRDLRGNDLVAPETQRDLKGLRALLDLCLHRCRHLDVLGVHPPRFFLRLIARQLINDQELRLQIAMQHEMLTAACRATAHRPGHCRLSRLSTP